MDSTSAKNGGPGGYAAIDLFAQYKDIVAFYDEDLMQKEQNDKQK